ncbi:MAG: hypothetical protein LUD25_01180 [Coriobacteriaceae bacterium]|nr:hypothetical protein [Coriobacteriaceae bacterium]
MVSGIERREKHYVEVIVDVDPEGEVTPLELVWEDGRHFEIERLIERRRAASMKVGGYGIRYTVQIGGRQRHLWQDDSGWYVEEIVHDGITTM